MPSNRFSSATSRWLKATQITVCWWLSSPVSLWLWKDIGQRTMGKGTFRAIVDQGPRPPQCKFLWNQTVTLLQTHFCQPYGVNLHEFRKVLIYGKKINGILKSWLSDWSKLVFNVIMELDFYRILWTVILQEKEFLEEHVNSGDLSRNFSSSPFWLYDGCLGFKPKEPILSIKWTVWSYLGGSIKMRSWIYGICWFLFANF